MSSIYLKRLEIYGFKSFPYKTTVELHPGITAIVGPNGAGKSNLLDAIKWVLGEGSPKRLRVKEMADLIYSGDHGRKVDFAEVKLTLSHDPPVLEKFKDFAEISIVRRFYRDGEGEFFINQKPCRLRDIQLLLLDLGISNQGYSIIDQGDVAKFIELSAKERRIFLEDLAGVSKIKFTEAEVVKNIGKTEFNLIRIKDLLLEVERQYLTLKEQADKAKKYLEVKQRFLILSLALKEKQAEKTKSELEEVRLKLRNLKEEKVAIEREIERLEQMENNDQIILSELSLKLKSLRVEEANLEAELKSLNQSLNNVLREEVEVRARREKEKLRLANEEEGLKKVASEEMTIHEELAKLHQKRVELQRIKEEKNEALSKIKKELESKKAELTRVENTWQELLRKDERLQEKKGLLEKQKQTFEKELSRLKEDAFTLDQRDKFTKERLAKLALEKKEVEDNLQKVLQESSLLKSKQEELSLTLSNLREEIILASSHINRLTKTVEFLDSLLKKESMPEQFDLPLERILGYRFKDLSSEELKILEFVLGERLKAIVVKDINEVEVLSKKTEENLIFILEGELKRYEFSQFNYNKKTGTITSPDGFIYLMKKEKKGIFSLIKEREEQAYELKFWQKKNKELKEKEKEILKEKEDISKEIKKLAESAEELEKKLKSLLSIERELEKESFKREERKKNLKEEILRLEERYQNTVSEIVKLNQGLEEIQMELLALEREKKAKKEEVSTIEKDFLNLKKNLETLDREFLELNTRISYLNERLRVLQVEKERALSNIKSSKFKLERFERELSVLAESITSLKERRNNLEKILTDVKNSIKEIEEKRESTASHLRELQEKRKALERSANKLTVEVHNISLRERELELLLANLKEEIRGLKESFFTEEENYTGVLTTQEEKDLDLEREVSKLREELKRFGEVNIHSIREFEAVEWRYKELLSHKEDLEASIAKLKDVLRELNESARLKLVQTLEKVNERAKEVFSELFPSSQAELVLIGDDPLTAGLEIKIRIPNKNVKGINMLSGGEKALCVIGFLLSFYLVNPSPLLILDEVDAPLDEKNSVKFVRLLRKITENSQVILITHNPQVMKEVDLLLGVTMEDNGISKVLTLNLKNFAQQGSKKAILS